MRSFGKKSIFYNALIVSCSILLSSQAAFCAQEKTSEKKDALSDTQETTPKASKTIKNIFIEGNKYVKKEAILKRLPFRQNEQFDKDKTSVAINNLYALGNFRQITIESEELNAETLNLYIINEKKKLLEGITFKGNKSLRTKQIKEKLNLDKVSTVDEETIEKISRGVKKLYQEENRHMVSVTHALIPSKENPDKTCVEFTVHEGPSSRIKFVHFSGNKEMPDRKLRGVIFTRENWLLSFMDSAGTYNSEMLEMDKHRLEYFYRDHGYLMAKVPKAIVEYSASNRDISVTFSIKEGCQFFIRELHVVGDEIHSEDELLPLVTLESGQPFSQSKLVNSINKIKDLYGEKGYINCDVYPQIKPDETTNEVDVTFHVERGNKLYANKIVITGNKITRDKVIRRQLDILEGELITTRKLLKSQNRVEYLSFFERDSVNWKVHRISDTLADLEMNVKETKTGNMNFMLSYGTDQYNPEPSLRGMFSVEKANLMGLGWDVGGLVQASRKHLRRLEAHFLDPNILDSDVSGFVSFYSRWDEYDQWHGLDKTPRQRVLGGNLRFGFMLPQIDKELSLFFEIGIENIQTNNPKARNPLAQDFELIVRRTFQEGTVQWFGIDLVKDTRDHQVYPKHGYKIVAGTKLAIPGLNHQFSFFKVDAEASYYTPLIEKFIMDDSLVLCLHGKLGTIQPFASSKIIPYKELYHIGGQTTVRGFTWGGIGPAWYRGLDPLGAKNALVFNTELIFPLIPDYSMKAHVFYDAGAGWDTPKDDIPSIDRSKIKRDKFDLRHSVGFGLNLVKPVPAKIDWGFKLDRKRKEGESAQEFHLSMNQAF